MSEWLRCRVEECYQSSQGKRSQEVAPVSNGARLPTTLGAVNDESASVDSSTTMRSVDLLGVEMAPPARQAAIDKDDVRIGVGYPRRFECRSAQHPNSKAQAPQPLARFRACVGSNTDGSCRAQVMGYRAEDC